MSRTITEVELEISYVREAIASVIRGGQSYSIGSGGSTRAVTQATIPQLKSHLIDLQQELATLNCSTETKGISLGASW